MPADLDFSRLRVLAAVARTGSLTAAARDLGIAQPSVSHHLSRLEVEAGLPLLERVGRGVQLTEAGRLLAARAEEILGRVEGVRRELDALAGLRAGRARLAAFPSALATIVPTAIAALVADHPGLGVGLVGAEPPEAVEALAEGDVDVALVFEHTDVQHTRSVSDLSRFVVTPVLDEPVHLVRKAPVDDDVEPSLADLAGADWIAGCPRCRADLVARCAAAGFAPHIAFETDDTLAVQALVAAGAGVSLLPDLALRAHHDSRVVAHPLPGARRRVLALTLGAPTPPARELLARLVAAGGGPGVVASESSRSRDGAGTSTKE